MPLKKLFQHKDVFINQEIENIIKNAQSRDFVISKKYPTDKEGIDGELRIFYPNPDYVSILIKLSGHWHEINLNDLLKNKGKIIPIADHDQLLNVRHYTNARNGDGHITKQNGENWENHRLAVGNPHGTTFRQTITIGTETQRPLNPQIFDLFGNLTTKQLEMWNGEKWVILG
jgi:hypothetical protein